MRRSWSTFHLHTFSSFSSASASKASAIRHCSLGRHRSDAIAQKRGGADWVCVAGRFVPNRKYASVTSPSRHTARDHTIQGGNTSANVHWNHYREPRRRRLDRPHLLVRLTHSTALWIQNTLGQRARKNGVAKFTLAAARRPAPPPPAPPGGRANGRAGGQAGGRAGRRPTARVYMHLEAGLCRRPYCVYKGSPTKREAR